MPPRSVVEREVSRKFSVPAPTLLSHMGKSPPMAFSLLQDDGPMQDRSKISPGEDAYVACISLGLAHMQLWLRGREVPVAPVKAGSVVLLHMDSEPAVKFNSQFEVLRCHISKETLDELSEEASGYKSDGLRRPELGAVDPLMFHLASSTAPLLKRGGPNAQLLLDQLALAVHSRLSAAYGGSPRDERYVDQGGLSPWQERRAKDFIVANLHRRLSIQAISSECRLSPSHFARAFKNSTGRPPHRWVLEQRIDAAKADLVDSDLTLAEIATKHGFADPSHFSRVFFKMTGEAPAGWRRSWSRGAPVPAT